LSLFEPFESLLRAQRPQGLAKAAGWVGLDVPVEILEACGFSPIRVRADAAAPGAGADELGEGGGHPGMKAVAARLLDGVLEPLSCVAIGSTPVTGVWLYNLLLSLGEGRPGGARWPAVLVDVARQDAPSAQAHNLRVMRDFAARLGAVQDAAHGATPDIGALGASIRTRNVLRRGLRAVEALRCGPRPTLTGAKARLVLDAADLLPSREAAALVEVFLDGAKSLPAATGRPVIYSGTGGPALTLYQALESQGLCIVGDDQDFGSRAIGPDVAETGDPLAALAERYRRRSPASAGWSAKRRSDDLLSLARARRAEAVIFELAPFDHPAAWDQPKQAQAATAAGLKVILLPASAWRDPEGAARQAASVVKGAAHV